MMRKHEGELGNKYETHTQPQNTRRDTALDTATRKKTKGYKRDHEKYKKLNV